MENIKQELMGLDEKFGKIQGRVEAIPEEILTIEKRAEKRKRDLDQTLKDIEEARKERQKTLVSGGKTDSLSQRIKFSWENCDLIEDEILGLKGKVQELHFEREKLLEEKNLVQDQIIRTKLIHPLKMFNENSEAASRFLRDIIAIMDEHGISFVDGWQLYISCSSWIGLRSIPRLSLAGAPGGQDFISLTEIGQKRNSEMIEQHARAIRDARGET